MKIHRFGWLSALCLFVAMAEEPKKTPEKKPANGAGQSGMVIVRTPDGGLRAPTAEEHRALTGQGLSSVLATSGAPQEQVLGGGRGVMLALDPATSTVFSVAKRGPDGKIILQEAVGDKAAERLLKEPAPAAKVEVKEAAQ